jgi:hypothetical protein
MTINPEGMTTADLVRGAMLMYRQRCGGPRNMTVREHLIYIAICDVVDMLDGDYCFRAADDTPIAQDVLERFWR